MIVNVKGIPGFNYKTKYYNLEMMPMVVGRKRKSIP